ncbi:MAG: PIN domain-containing protein [Candidatus Scalindua sp.]|nr:PIN domain-containing protein [Candidatus Scalindua sp.]
MKIYFDNCCIQRPFDDKSQIRIRIDAEAVISIIELIEEKKIELVASSIVELELSKTPDPERVAFGLKVLSLSSKNINLSDKIINRAKEFEKKNVKAIDALHLAIGDIEKIDYICTTDDRFIKRAQKIKNLKTKVISPLKFIEEYEK